MSRKTWDLIKLDKNFNVNIYRKGLTALILSLLLSCGLAWGIFNLYKHLPERDYYATSGITFPVQLTALSTRNNSSEALLAPDPPDDDELRPIPQ